MLIVGLAPGLRGANRTGRPFTGDYAGDLLYATLIEFGFASGTYDRRPDDGLKLADCAIVNAVRCVPPQNKPTPQEIATCRRYLAQAISALPRLRIMLALGRIAHESALRALSLAPAKFRFAHGARHALTPGWPLALRQLSLLALQHQHRRADGGDVSRSLRLDPRRARRLGAADAGRGMSG